MAEKEKEIPDPDFINEQTDDAKLLNRIKVDPKNIVIQDSHPHYDDIEQENGEITQKDGNDNDIERTTNSLQIEKNSLQMRLKVLNMEVKIVKTFIEKNLIENDCETSKNIDNIGIYIGKVKPADDELSIAEDLSTELMKKIYAIVKKNTAQREVKKTKHDVEVPDYRSIVTVRGTKEDVLNCILKATAAFENGNYDRAERLLLKAERMFPSKNARDLLMQLQTYKATKLNRELTENATKAVEQAYTVNEHTEKTQIPEFSCFIDDEKQKEIKTQIETQSKDETKTENTKLKKCIEPENNKTFDDQEGSLEKNKDITNEQVKNNVPPPVPKRIKKSNQAMVKKPIRDDKVSNAMKIGNTGQELYPNTRSKDKLGIEDKKETSNVIKSQIENKSIKRAKTYSSNGEVEKLNCYEFPVGSNESNRRNASECIEVAQAAFQKDQYDKAERFLLKSLKIEDSQKTKSMLETVRNAKSNNTNNTVKIDEKYNEHVNDKSQTKNMNEHSSKLNPINPDDDDQKQHNQDVGTSQPSSDKDNTSKTVNSGNDKTQNINLNDVTKNNLATKFEENLVKAKRFVSKFIPNNPDDDARKQHIQDVGVSQRSSYNKGSTSKFVNSDNDSQRQKEANMFLKLANDAKNGHRIVAARYYLKRASERELSEKERELLQDIETNMRSGGDSLSRKEMEREAHTLLVKVEDFIKAGDLENAEIVLTVSWNMHRSPNIIRYHKTFLKARMALFKKEKENCSDGGNDGISENIFQCDTLVEAALTKYENEKFEEAVELLKQASALHPCVRINQLLDGIEAAQNTLVQKLKRSKFYT